VSFLRDSSRKSAKNSCSKQPSLLHFFSQTFMHAMNKPRICRVKNLIRDIGSGLIYSGLR